ncbi:2' O-ribose methyltransferase [Yamadazyma tenuis]|nr:2' O-ribose methyltransferase [Yamadazyma tenuis]
MRSQSKLYHINEEFQIFNRHVTKILDLGYVPGNWLEFSKLKMCEVHGLPEDQINSRCHFLGFDILMSPPPPYTSSMQGNVFSKAAHKQIIDHFKELALREKLIEPETDSQNSYFVNEQTDSRIDEELEKLETGLRELRISANEGPGWHYKPDLILSDLSLPFIQDKGFYHNTQTKPHMRLANNPGLNEPVFNKQKSSIDMADVSLLLSCELLKQHGNLVIRMASVDLEDPELEVLSQRLERVFSRVEERQPGTEDEIFFICLDKKEDAIDKSVIFTK